jgi:hypothetical protein
VDVVGLGLTGRAASSQLARAKVIEAAARVQRAVRDMVPLLGVVAVAK